MKSRRQCVGICICGSGSHREMRSESDDGSVNLGEWSIEAWSP